MGRGESGAAFNGAQGASSLNLSVRDCFLKVSIKQMKNVGSINQSLLALTLIKAQSCAAFDPLVAHPVGRPRERAR